MKYGLPDTVVKDLCAIFARYPEVNEVILYGSRAKGNYRTGSDIDMTLCGDGDISLQVLFRILDEIDELLLPYTIDLSIYDDIGDQDVLDHIRRVGLPFYAREPRAGAASG